MQAAKREQEKEDKVPVNVALDSEEGSFNTLLAGRPQVRLAFTCSVRKSESGRRRAAAFLTGD